MIGSSFLIGYDTSICFWFSSPMGVTRPNIATGPFLWIYKDRHPFSCIINKVRACRC